MTKYTKKFLVELRKQFKGATPREAREMWNILSALRGPDTVDSHAEKKCTTAVIRMKVLGQSLDGKIPAIMEKDNSFKADNRVNIEFESYHFKSHMEYAFEALGLKWNEVNK